MQNIKNNKNTKAIKKLKILFKEVEKMIGFEINNKNFNCYSICK